MGGSSGCAAIQCAAPGEDTAFFLEASTPPHHATSIPASPLWKPGCAQDVRPAVGMHARFPCCQQPQATPLLLFLFCSWLLALPQLLFFQ